MNLFTDDPIQNAKDDQLHRDVFANRIAEVCRHVHAQGESSVIALIGPWGSGKSSVLNLVRQALKKDEDWLIGEFNPWLLSDIESLIRTFFGELRDLLPPENQTGKVRDTLRSYSDAVSPIASMLGLFGMGVPEPVKEIAQQLLKGDTSLSKRKRELEDSLREAKRPILIIMDDLDRLEPDELMMVFKLVRLVGRLPNVYYLLSYDERTLLDVIMQTELAKGDRERAHSYLEKIVQLRLDLPPLHSAQQIKLVNAAFDEVATKNKAVISESDQQVLNDSYGDVYKYFLTEPRAINRYFAQVDALYPLVDGEVNFADFTLITFIRTEFPRIHQLVQRNKDELVNSPSFELGLFGDKEKPEDRLARWRKYLDEEACSSPDKVLRLLSLIFLPIKGALEGTSYSGGFYDDLNRGKRIGSPDYFDRYFQFGVPETDISDVEVRKRLSELKNKSKAKAAAKWIYTKLIADPVLLLRKVTAERDTPEFPSSELMVVLAEGYNDLLPNTGMFGLDAKFDVIRLVRQLFHKLESSQRDSVVKAVLNTKAGLNMLADLVDTALPEENKKKELDADAIAINEEIVAFKPVIEENLKEHLSGLAQKTVNELTIDDQRAIYRLSRIIKDEIRPALWGLVEKSKWQLLDFVAWFVPTSTMYGSGPVRQGLGEMGIVGLETLFDVDKLITKLGNALDEDPGDLDRDAAPTLENKKIYMLSLLRGEQERRKTQSNPEEPTRSGS